MNIIHERKRLNLKNDVIFKAFFSRKGNEEFLIDFLESILKINITEIEIREEVNVEKLAKEEKGGRLDLQAKLNDGIIVNIELQIKNEYNIEERTTYYSSKVISRETERGVAYKDLNQVIMINILGYEMFEFEEYISETAVVLEKHREYEVLKNIKWYFIELPKFRRKKKDMNEKFNQWLAFIDDENEEVVKMAEEKNPKLKKARKEMSYLTGEEETKRLVELREKWEMDYASAIKQGLEDGKKQGIKQGIEKGTNLIAKEMIKNKYSLEEIMKITGLNKEEIEKLKKEI